MKKSLLGAAGMFLTAVLMANPVLAAELLDVKPVVSASGVMVEITADIPMTYTYYKVPGQARAVVDIADADPEKVEPLIVVNKGALSSISVDKAMIADMTVSRLVFNLMSESEISVKQEADRKKITVSFAGGKVVIPAAVVVPPPVVAPSAPVAAAVVERVITAAPQKVETVVTAPVNPLSKEEDDPLGLDEPKPKPVAAVVASPPIVARSVKLEPVVPVLSAEPSVNVVVKGIIIGASYIEIQTSGNVEKTKHMKLVKPDRLVVDIAGTSTIAVKTISVNKFGIAKVRIGTTPGVVRIVLDASKVPFPGYSVDSTENGVRINFK